MLALFPADHDDDGDVDLLIFTLLGSGDALVNDGTGRFTRVADVWRSVYGGGIPTLTLADVDDDGHEDLIEGTATGVYFGLGVPGGFSFATDGRIDNVQTGYARTEFADIDLDGDLDLYLITDRAEGDRVYVNRHRQLSIPSEIEVGSALSLHLHAQPEYSPANANGVVLLSLAAATAPIPTPFGNFLIEPTATVLVGSVTIPAVVGFAELALSIPNDPMLSGWRTEWQAVIVQATSPFPELALSNRIVRVVR